MKTRILAVIPVLLLALSANISAQVPDSTGLPGDNFDLQAALEVFKSSKSPENFEEILNKEDSHVNNLDLDNDGNVDFIRVEDHMEDKAHAIVLQVVLGKDETQDIAVIEIEKTDENTAILQIIGDEAIYGEEVIVEPFDEEATSDGKGGPNADYALSYVTVNVIAWPCVRFVYRPGYVVYRSPVRWGYVPFVWWRPWRRYSWNRFHVHIGRHHHKYRVVKTHRVVHAHRVYTPKRKRSVVVHNQTRTTVKARGTNVRAAGVTSTTTTKAVRTPKGTAVGKKTTTTKAVKTPNGRKVTKTTSKKGAVKTKNGAAAGKKTKTVKKKSGAKGTAKGKKTTTKKVRRKKGN